MTHLKPILTAFILSFALPVLAQQAGKPDESFNSTGIKVYDVNESTTTDAIALQADGKSVVVGTVWGTDKDCYIARFNGDGSFDQDFATSGVGIFDYNADGWDAFLDVAILPDGKILAMGEHGEVSAMSVLLVRFLSNGKVDQTFGNNGIVIQDISAGTNARPKRMAVQPDGKIIVTGTQDHGNYPNGIVARFTANGTLDNTFKSTGIIYFNFGDASHFADVKLFPDGKILLCGYGKVAGVYRVLLYRLLANGEPDQSFGSSGATFNDDIKPNMSELTALIEIDKHGSIYAIGNMVDENDKRNLLIIKLEYNGKLDKSFGDNGVLISDFTMGAEEFPVASALQPDGNLLVTGSYFGNEFDFFIVRYKSNGSLDYSFNESGYVLNNLSPSNPDLGSDIVIDAVNQKVFITGYLMKAGAFSSFVARLHLGNMPTSVSENTLKNGNISIYPNPVNNILNIKTDEVADYNISITDQLGRTIVSPKIYRKTPEVLLNVSALQNGFYYVNIISENGSTVLPFMKN